MSSPTPRTLAEIDRQISVTARKLEDAAARVRRYRNLPGGPWTPSGIIYGPKLRDALGDFREAEVVLERLRRERREAAKLT